MHPTIARDNFVHLLMILRALRRPLVKECVPKNYFPISQPKHVVGIQKNRLIETVLLSTQNIRLNRLVRKYLQIFKMIGTVLCLERWIMEFY